MDNNTKSERIEMPQLEAGRRVTEPETLEKNDGKNKQEGTDEPAFNEG